MLKPAAVSFCLALFLPMAGCGSDATKSDDDTGSSTAKDAGKPSTKDAGSPKKDAGHDEPAVVEEEDAGAHTSVQTKVDAGSVAAHDSGSSQSTGDAGGTTGGDAGAHAGGTSLTGMLGALGAVKPIVSSYVISTGLETLVYLSSAPLTCELIMKEGGKWLLALPAGSQVIELVVRGAATVGTAKIGPAEANYAQGGMSSAGEKTASSGSLTFTKAEAKGVVEGTVMATYTGGSLMGTFHAEFCQGGQEW